MTKAERDFFRRMTGIGADDVREALPAEMEGESFPRTVGVDHFDALTPEEQDAKFGPDLATALRDGKVALADIVTTKNGFLVRKPIDELNLPQDQNS